MENTNPDSALPIAKNNGSYGELGHWGKRTGRHIRRKKLRLLVILFLGITTLFIADQGAKGVYPGTPSHPSPLDPNTIIWEASNPNGDGSEFGLNGFSYKTNCKDSINCIQTNNILASEGGGFSNVGLLLTKVCPDLATFSCGAGQLGIQAERTGILTAITVGLKKTLAPTGQLQMNVYDTRQPGASDQSSCTGCKPNATSTNTIDISTLTTAMASYTFNFNGTFSLQRFTSNQWYIFGVTVLSGAVDGSNFVTVSGSSGSCTNTSDCGNPPPFPCGGGNCDTNIGRVNLFADSQVANNVLRGWIMFTTSQSAVALTKSQIGDLSVASGKTLGFNFTWSSFNPNANAIIGMFLTINKTLPTTSNWSPYNDTSVVWLDRLSCTVSCGTNGTQTWRMRQYAIRSQGVGDTLQSEDIGCNASGSCFLTATDSSQAGSPSTVFNYGMNLLNYTGGTEANPVCSFSGGVFGGGGCSWIANGLMPNGSPSASVSARTGLPAFQFQAQQYYLGFFALNNTSSQVVQFGFQNLNIYTYNTGTPVATPPNIDTGGFFGPVVKFFINGAVFIINQLMLYGAFLGASLQVAFNRIGLFFGWGPIGDNIASFFAGIGSLFSQVGTVLGWVFSLVAGSISTIQASTFFANPYFAGLVIFLNDFKNAVGSGVIINMLTEIAFWLPTSYMIILISFYFLLVLMNGLKGFFEWVHIVKWSSFALAEVFARILQILIKFITAILGRLSVISPGHEFPKIPHLHPGPLPKIDLGFREMALFHDPTAWFLGVTGIVFTYMWAGTTASGLPAATTSIINTMQSLTLTLFGISFMVLILIIPGWLIGKMAEKGLIRE